MKTFFALLTVSIAISSAACAQKIEASKVPVAVKESFAKQFPGAKANWEKEGGKYEAGFKQHKNEMSALFETNGTMTESEMEIKMSDLPIPVAAYIKKHHNGAMIQEAAKITKANGEINYEAEVKGKDLIFDEKGNFLKEGKE